MILLLALTLCIGTWDNALASHNHQSRHERNVKHEVSPDLFGDWFNPSRLRHRTLRTERSVSHPYFGADFDLPALSHERTSRQYLQPPTVLAKRPVKRREVMHVDMDRPAPTGTQAERPRTEAIVTRLRQALSPAGADINWLRAAVLRQCWDDVERFVRERENGR